MHNRNQVILFFLLITLCPGIRALQFSAGTAAFIRFHKSANTFKLTPGFALTGSCIFPGNLECSLELAAGALIGHSLLAGMEACYRLEIGAWQPCAGLFLDVDFGGIIAFTQSSSSLVYPYYPEWCAGIVIKPLRFSTEKISISFINITAGTDITWFGKILLLDLDLLSLQYRF